MPEFDAVQAKILRSAIASFQQAMQTELAEPIRAQLRDYRPAELSELDQELALVSLQLGRGEPPFAVHDIHATLLHQLGIDHERFTVKFQGLDAKLTGVEGARVVNEILA